MGAHPHVTAPLTLPMEERAEGITLPIQRDMRVPAADNEEQWPWAIGAGILEGSRTV